MTRITKGTVKDNVITLGTVMNVGGAYSTRKFSLQPTMMYSGVRIDVPESPERQTEHFIVNVDFSKYNIHVGPDHLLYEIIDSALCDDVTPRILIRNIMYVLHDNLALEDFIGIILDEMVHIHILSMDKGMQAAKKEVIEKLGLN